MQRSDNTADGTPGAALNVNTIAKADPASSASNVGAIGINYSAEPTSYGTQAFGLPALNGRATLLLEWDPEEAPEFGPNQTLALQAAPPTAAAVALKVAAEWEEF